MQDSFSYSFADIKVRFVGLLADQERRLRGAYGDLRETPPKISELATVRDIAHKIAGTAGTLGFPELGQKAEQAEDLIRDRFPDSSEIDQNILRSIHALIQACQACRSDFPMKNAQSI